MTTETEALEMARKLFPYNPAAWACNRFDLTWSSAHPCLPAPDMPIDSAAWLVTGTSSRSKWVALVDPAGGMLLHVEQILAAH